MQFRWQFLERRRAAKSGRAGVGVGVAASNIICCVLREILQSSFGALTMPVPCEEGSKKRIKCSHFEQQLERESRRRRRRRRRRRSPGRDRIPDKGSSRDWL